MFVYRPALLLMDDKGRALFVVSDAGELGIAVGAACLGVLALSVAVTGYFKTMLLIPIRILCVIAAALLLLPHIQVAGNDLGIAVNIAGAALFVAVAVINTRRARRKEGGETVSAAITE